MSIRETWARALDLFRRDKLERQTEAEMRFHLQMEAENAIRRGVPAERAEGHARIRAGSVTAAMEDVRAQRGYAWLDGLSVDLRQSWSALRRRPGFMLVAGGAIASAVAVNTLVAAIGYGVLLQRLPYRDPERLVRVFEYSKSQPKFPLSIYNYEEDKRHSRTLDGIALYLREDLQLTHGESAEPVSAVAITDDFFPTLGVAPALGRNFAPNEMTDSSRVVILSNEFWRSRMGADAAILGKTLRLNREPWTIVGVAPEGFQYPGGTYRSPLQGEVVEIWRPLNLKIDPGCAKGCHFTNAIARLKPGVSLAAVRDDLNRIMESLARQFPDSYSGRVARIEPLSAEVVGNSRPTILVIVAAGALVLCLACINVAGLSVARVLARRRELAVRQALGGNSWRILRVILSENLVLGALAGAVGMAAAAALLPALRAALPEHFPRAHEIVFRWQTGAFAFLAALIATIVAGFVAGSRRAAADPSEALNDDTRGSSTSASAIRLRGVLVGAQMGLACVLCFAAVLLLRSSIAVAGRSHGFDPRHVLTFELDMPPTAYPARDSGKLPAFYAEAARRLARIPGVSAAGFATSVPWTGYDENSGIEVEGYTPAADESMSARYQAVGPGFFDAIGTPVVAGRAIEISDDEKAPKVVVVNEAFAKRYFARRDPIGRYMQNWDGKRRIVGVVADVRDHPADLAAEPAFWMPLAQMPFSQVRAAVRAAGDPLALVAAVRAELHALDPELPLAEVRAMDDIAAAALSERRFALLVCEGFAALAVLLSAIGVYAMLTYTVQQRRREIGIRMALGATRLGVLRAVALSGLSVAAIGAAAGALLAPAAGKALESLLFGIAPADAVALVAAPTLLIAVALVGCLAPGWMAVRTFPVAALRDQ